MTEGGKQEDARPQWEAAGGAHSSVDVSLEAIEGALERLRKHSDTLYDRAPDAYLERALADLRGLVEQAEWLRRVMIDEARARNLLAQRNVAAASGVSYTTIQRWGNDPLLTFLGEYGPDAPVDTSSKSRHLPAANGDAS